MREACNDISWRELSAITIKPGSKGCTVLIGTLNHTYTAVMIAFIRATVEGSDEPVSHDGLELGLTQTVDADAFDGSAVMGRVFPTTGRRARRPRPPRTTERLEGGESVAPHVDSVRIARISVSRS